MLIKDLVIIVLGVAVVTLGSQALRRYSRRRARRRGGGPRILFPFTAGPPPQPVLDAALRLARTERATLVPAYLATVPLILPLDAAVPRQAEHALTLLDAIDAQAAKAGVAVDGRIERGRSTRHALKTIVECEPHDRLVIAASATGFTLDDLAWVLDHGHGEVLILRPAGAPSRLTPRTLVRQMAVR